MINYDGYYDYCYIWHNTTHTYTTLPEDLLNSVWICGIRTKNNDTFVKPEEN